MTVRRRSRTAIITSALPMYCHWPSLHHRPQHRFSISHSRTDRAHGGAHNANRGDRGGQRCRPERGTIIEGPLRRATPPRRVTMREPSRHTPPRRRRRRETRRGRTRPACLRATRGRRRRQARQWERRGGVCGAGTHLGNGSEAGQRGEVDRGEPGRLKRALRTHTQRREAGQRRRGWGGGRGRV